MTEQRPQVTRLKTGKSGRTVGCGFGQLFQESVTTVEEYSDPDGFLRGLVVRLTHWLHKFILVWLHQLNNQICKQQGRSQEFHLGGINFNHSFQFQNQRQFVLGQIEKHNQ